jgi:hypothetical protein
MEEDDIKQVKNLIHMENENRKVLNIEMLSLTEKLNKLKDKQILKSDNKTLLKKYIDDLKIKQDYKIKPIREDNKSINNAKIHYFYLDISVFGSSIYLKLSTCFSGGSYTESDKLKLKLNALKDKLNKNNYEQVKQEKKLLYKEIEKIKPYSITHESNLYLGQHEQGILKEVEPFKKQELLNITQELKLLTELEDLKVLYDNKKKQVNSLFEPIYKYFRGGV